MVVFLPWIDSAGSQVQCYLLKEWGTWHHQGLTGWTCRVCVHCVQCSYVTGLHTGCVCALLCAVFLWYWTAHRVCTCGPKWPPSVKWYTRSKWRTYVQLHTVHHCSGLWCNFCGCHRAMLCTLHSRELVDSSIVSLPMEVSMLFSPPDQIRSLSAF